ncbi:MAG: ribonuclease E/G [Caulobacter sp.]
MSGRQFFLDRGVGETRGVVTLEGRPERLLIQRDGDIPALELFARNVARVRSVEKAIGVAFLDLPGGVEALYSLRADELPPVRGASIEVEIRTEARQDKLATVRLIGPAEGEPRLLQAAPEVEAEIRDLAKGGKVVEGFGAREAADAAEAEALETIHPLPGGGSMAIEPTRALVSIDVDLGGRPGSDTKRAARLANLTAIGAAGRLLRLKGLGGLVVFDFVGRGHDGKALLGAARAAFGPDNPGVAIDQISRFGTLTLTVPRRRRPVLDLLTDGTGALTPLTVALRLARRLEREGRADPGGRLAAACAPSVLQAFAPLRAGVTDKLGARFTVEAREGWPVDRLEVAGA